MDRALFDEVRRRVENELAAQGQEVKIPDPEDDGYLGAFMALQKRHPRLAAQLAQAEHADPAQLLPNRPDKSPRLTWRHRLTHLTERLWMRRGLDGQPVWNRNRVLRSALYTVGAVAVGGLVYSVFAPRPQAQVVTASTQSSTSPGTSRTAAGGSTGGQNSADTSGAFPSDKPKGSTPNPNQPTNPATQKKLDDLKKDGPFKPAAGNAGDSAPQPTSASTPNRTLGAKTPPPPDAFRKVAPDPTSTPAPIPAAAAVPFGGAPDAQRVQPLDLAETRPPVTLTVTRPKTVKALTSTPPTVSSDTLFGGGDDSTALPNTPPAPITVTKPTPLKTVKAPTYTPPPISSNTLFGGGDDGAARPDTPPAPITASDSPAMLPREVAPPPAHGEALIYQRPPEQATAERRSALLYEASSGRDAPTGTDAGSSRSALLYQEATQGQGTTATGGQGGALLSQGGTASTTAAATPEAFGTGQAQADPDAPKFSPTAQIPGKTMYAIRTAAGLAVPAVVVSNEGNWVGTATYNPALGRVDMNFTSFVNVKAGKTYPVQALGYQLAGGSLAQGVEPNVHPIAPTAKIDLLRAGVNTLNVYAQALLNAGTIITNGSVTTTTRQVPSFTQLLGGELGKLAQLPEGNQTINIVADVAASTDIVVLFGVTASGSDNP